MSQNTAHPHNEDELDGGRRPTWSTALGWLAVILVALFPLPWWW